MRFGQLIFLGTLIGVSACVWLTATQTHIQIGTRSKPVVPLRTPTPTGTSPSPTVTPLVAGQSNVKLLLYGVTLTVTDPIFDLVYGEVTDGSDTWAGFTTQKLLAKYPACKAGALGTLVRIKATPTPIPKPSPSLTPFATQNPYPTYTPTNKPFSKYVGGYIYTYRPGYYNCATDQAGMDELAADRAAVKNGALPTLQVSQ